MEVIRNEKPRGKSISKIFAKYIFVFCIVISLCAGAEFLLFASGINKGIILPANYYEQKIEKNRDKISEAEYVNDLIPQECNYAVYDSEGNIYESNVSQDKALEMFNTVQNNGRSSGSYYYKVIQRKNEICIAEYRVRASFSNPVLNKYIINPDYLLNFGFIVIFISSIITFSRLFRRRLEKEMKILKNTTEKIKMENLDFKVKYSKITEINEVIIALDKMKEELNKSLKKQWNMEQMKNEQMGALAHDLKTPLTIIKGNSELLREMKLEKDAAQFNMSIINEVKNMEFYIKTLIEIMKSEKECELIKKRVNLKEFTQDIIETGKSLCNNKNIEFQSRINNIPEYITCDKSAIKRALINVISNGIDYAGENEKVLFIVKLYEHKVMFTVEDSGRGFTNEELKSAAEQFFQGDKSRNSKNHYGMGLYIAKKLFEKHNGNIHFENSAELGGAKVTLELPLEGQVFLS